jgi:hypothetical protein
MLAEGLINYDALPKSTWLTLFVGVWVSILVYILLHRRAVRRRRLAGATEEGDLPWEELLQLLRERGRELAESGAPAEEEMPPEELLKLLLSRRPNKTKPKPREVPPEEVEFLQSGGANLRASPRRWGNPTDVQIKLPYLSHDVDTLHGLVINRSAGGLAILVDGEIKDGTIVKVRSAEAPTYVPSVDVEVRYCRKAGRNHFIGCKFCGEIPWNVRVWFG